MQEISLFIQHHALLSYAFLTVLFLTGILEYVRLRSQAGHLNPAMAVLLMNREQAIVLDIRPKDAWLAGHISGAVHLPLEDLTKDDKKTDKFRGHPVIVTCATGSEAAKAAALLQKKGLDARVLAGGMPAWIAAGLPTIRS